MDHAATLLPHLRGDRATIRAGRPEDLPLLHAILSEPSVTCWWGEPDPTERLAADLRGEGDSGVLLVIEAAGTVAGGIYYTEETEPMYRHAGIDIFLGAAVQGRGFGREAVALVARFLIEERGHHRLTIDPAVANERAIRCYRSVGFRPVGVMRRYERGPDGTFHDGLLMDMLAGEVVDAPA